MRATVVAIVALACFSTGAEAGWVGDFVEGVVNAPGKIIEEVKELPQTIEDLPGDIKEEFVETISNTDREDTINSIRTQYQQARATLNSERGRVAVEFDSAITEMRATVEHVTYMGIDPHRVRNSDGSFIDLVAQLDALTVAKDATLGAIDAQLSTLDQSEQAAVNKANDTYR